MDERTKGLELQSQARKALAKLVVDVPGDAPPLNLLTGHKPTQQEYPLLLTGDAGLGRAKERVVAVRQLARSFGDAQLELVMGLLQFLGRLAPFGHVDIHTV